MVNVFTRKTLGFSRCSFLQLIHKAEFHGRINQWHKPHDNKYSTMDYFVVYIGANLVSEDEKMQFFYIHWNKFNKLTVKTMYTQGWF